MDASAWATVEEIFRDLLIFVGFMTVLLVALVVIISMLPADNPLKRTLTALSYRVGATAAVGALAIPIEPIPGTRRGLRHRRADPTHLVLVHVFQKHGSERARGAGPANRARPLMNGAA